MNTDYASCHAWRFLGNLAPVGKPVRNYRVDVIGVYGLVTDLALPNSIAAIELTRDGWGPIGSLGYTRGPRLHAISAALDRLVPMTPIDGGPGIGPAECVELADDVWVYRRLKDGYSGIVVLRNWDMGAMHNPEMDGCVVSWESPVFKNMPQDGLRCLCWGEGGG